MAGQQLSMFEEQRKAPPSPLRPSSFTLSKTINANPQKVYDHWLIPVFVGEWMFGSNLRQEKVVKLENKVRKGGEFAYTVNRGGEEILHTGEYLELDIPNKLVFSWATSTEPDCESLVTVQFQEAENKTRLKLTIRLAGELSEQKDTVKKEWASRCSALAAKFKKP